MGLPCKGGPRRVPSEVSRGCRVGPDVSCGGSPPTCARCSGGQSSRRGGGSSVATNTTFQVGRRPVDDPPSTPVCRHAARGERPELAGTRPGSHSRVPAPAGCQHLQQGARPRPRQWGPPWCHRPNAASASSPAIPARPYLCGVPYSTAVPNEKILALDATGVVPVRAEQPMG